MENGNSNGSSDKDMLFLMGGLALMFLGAGFVMSHSGVRKTISAGVASVLPELKGRFGPDIGAIGSDIERYLRLKSM